MLKFMCKNCDKQYLSWPIVVREVETNGSILYILSHLFAATSNTCLSHDYLLPKISWLKLHQELYDLHSFTWVPSNHGHPSRPIVNLLPPSISAAAAFSSSTSQLAHANRPLRNLASLLAAQTMKEAGRLAVTGDVSIIS